MPTRPPAVVLLSGGLDSATTLAIARDMNFECHALSFDYGQRHRFELDAARLVARSMHITDHRVATIDLRLFGGSALTDDIDVPKGDATQHAHMLSHPDDRSIPITYVPARNTIFLSFALAFAEVIDAGDIFIGINAIDYSGYPDCRPEYIQAFEQMANLATRRGVEGRPATIHAPLIHLTKQKIIERGIALGVDYGLTLSCYDPFAPDGRPHACGGCDSCQLRADGFAAAGIADPAISRSAAH